MEEKIEPMITGGVIASTQHRIIEKVRKRGNRTVETGFPLGPPIGVLPDQRNIFAAGLQEPGILKDKRVIVENETAAERIRIGQQSNGTEDRRHLQVPQPQASIVDGLPLRRCVPHRGNLSSNFSPHITPSQDFRFGLRARVC
jgi:hypothetical protein